MTDPVSQIAHLTLALDEEKRRPDCSEAVILAIEMAMHAVMRKSNMKMHVEYSRPSEGL